jgi:hypothetical protein
MPFNEALAWFGLTIVGIAGYFVVEKYIPPWGWIVLTIIGLVAVGYAVYHHHHPESPNPPIWVLLLALTWGVMGSDIYDRHAIPAIPEFDEPQGLLIGSNEVGPSYCSVIVDGGVAWPYRDDYELAMACFWTNGTADRLDVPVQPSALYEIHREHMVMRADVNKTFTPLLGHGTNFVILLVPKGVSTAQFTTLRQARALGVKIKNGGGNGGEPVP